MRWREKMRRDREQHETAGALDGSGQTPEPAAELVAVVRRLHAMVREARALLIDPTAGNVDDCGRRLDEVASALRKLLAGLPDGGQKHQLALASLRAEIGRVAMLLDSAAAFHMGWMHRAACMVSGYTANGTPATPETARRVSLEI
jgi:hypothetical protein